MPTADFDTPFRKTRRSIYTSIAAYVTLQRHARLHRLTMRELADALCENEALVSRTALRLRQRRAGQIANEAVTKPGSVECAGSVR